MEPPPPGEAHVWTVVLDRSEREVGALGGLLTADELLRAGEIASVAGRNRHVVARASLRRLLARLLGREPEQLTFGAGAAGKPRLDPESPLRFNLSHSGGLAAIAVARGAEVGVDVEQVTPRGDMDGVAQRLFSEREREALHSAPNRTEAFLRHWVAKEAFVKAAGRGLSSMRALEVLLDAPGGARVVHVGGDREEAARWTLAPLDPAPGYTAAVVAEGQVTVRPAARFDPLA